jgi:hypothetical protein
METPCVALAKQVRVSLKYTPSSWCSSSILNNAFKKTENMYPNKNLHMTAQAALFVITTN